MEMDHIDKLAESTLDGYLVHKDLVRTFSRQFPVPTYVVEFLLGRYCASTDPEEIEEGLEIVQRQLNSRTVKAGEEELFKAHAREKGDVKIIDLLSARLDAKTDSYLATLPSLQLKDVRISPKLVNEHERMLTGGFYAEITLTYDAAIAQEKNGRPFGIETLREIQLSKRDILDTLAEARKQFSTEEWKELLTDHFGLVSDFLSECMSQLRNQSRISVLQNRVYFGGALSGRDTNAVNKTISGLLKLIYPGRDEQIPDEELEWAVRIALETRRRVKEQQKRIGAAEFRNTHFSYVIGEEGVEKFVSTPELQSENSIGSDPLEPGQVWTISPGGMDEHPGLYRIEINEGPGSGLKILNKSVPPVFRESISFAEQNLYARSMQLVGDSRVHSPIACF